MPRISTSLQFTQGLNQLLALQHQAMDVRNQLSTGKRIVQPADDPVGAAALLSIQERLQTLTQFDRNGGQAEQRLNQVDDVMHGVANTVQRARDLLLQGRSEALGPSEREAIAAEVREQIDVLVALGNTRNASGEYLFSGASVNTRAFTRDAAGAVRYNGDQQVRGIRISESRTVADSFSGDEAFFAVRTGNGEFATGIGPANSGTAQISDNVLVDPGAFLAHDYRIVFTAPGTFDVIDDTAGANVLTGQTYNDGAPIAFDGMELIVFGQPATGDVFTVGPSRHRSVFATFDDIATTLEAGFDTPAGAARFGFELDRALENMELVIDHVAAVRAETGARLKAVESQRELHEDMGLGLQALRSKLEDVDLVEAVSMLTQQSTTLEAAQAAFTRIQGLSLFNFL